MWAIGLFIMIYNWDNPDEFWWWLGLILFIIGL